MKKTTQFLFTLVAFVFSSALVIAQSTVTGTIIDAELNSPLPGANVVEKGTTNGVSSDFDGNFTLTTQVSSGEVVLSYVGYKTITLPFNGNTNLGNITLSSDNSLEEIVVVGVVDFARDRETPVAVSTIKAVEIQEKLGSQELPEILNSTPSIYATKSGGGFGDARINVRGFDQTNVAVMINGVPINDMENGAVFWSNWAGLSDVATGIQVQRGLGSSKLAISSVGGTINVVTKTTDRKEGGSVGFTTGNSNYLKTVTSYSTGKMESGFATSVILSRSAGDGYVRGTEFTGYNYFLGFGYDKGDHNLQLTVTGAPQVHNQRTTSFFNMATLEDYLQYGRKYNYNHGSLNGEEFGWRRNFYHKPIASLNWDWDINEKSSLSTVLYASIGRGGGTGDIGRLGGNFASSSEFRNPNNGEVLWDQIVASNSGTQTTFNDGFVYGNTVDPYTGTFIVNDDSLRDGAVADAGANELPGVIRRNGAVRRASMNSHNWFGALANFNSKLSETLTLDFGVDLRSYKGIHYRRVDNFLGADGYRDNDNINNPFNVVTQATASDLDGLWNVFRSIDKDKKIDYYNDGKVRWLGAFTQLEYKKDKVSAFVQGAISQQGFQRVEYFLETPENRETDWENIIGGNVKGGLNFNIDDNHNVFANAGFYSRQPNFDAVWINFRNELNPNLKNETILGFELGYGLRLDNFKASVNLYRTSWKDRFLNISSSFDVNGTPNNRNDDTQANANLLGIQQVHTGVEFEGSYKINDFVSLNGMLSVGNWEYSGNVNATYFDDGNQPIVVGGVEQSETLYLDGVKVGDAAQFTSQLGIVVKPIEGLSFDASWRTADNLYADINAEDFNAEDHKGSLKLPAYDLVDSGLSYKIKVGKDKDNTVNLRLNVNNVFDEVYIAESATNTFAETGDTTFNGINVENKVFFGFGRTWNFGIRYNF
ncbi:TonB-dependent receptor [Flavivirga aquatica]|uniref:TonB-dependent receptor n=1 Tax=Flavivirga aquatica TaxID=1849968 RepID=A0A1E5TDA2_9FLAO|nr:TonB-dependent receptor [Flavivirga aquatica]OEK09354.1 TonB-dependent receptor [Flavivirga aquatica]